MILPYNQYDSRRTANFVHTKREIFMRGLLEMIFDNPLDACEWMPAGSHTGRETMAYETQFNRNWMK